MIKSIYLSCLIVTAFIFSACQQEEGPVPVQTSDINQEVIEEPGKADKSINGRTVSVLTSRVDIAGGDPTFNHYTLTAVGSGSYCSPADKLIVYWYLRTYDDNGNLLSQTHLRTDSRKYACIQKGTLYASAGVNPPSYSHINASIYARFYRGDTRRLVAESESSIVTINWVQWGQ